jgi:hypothetical protein
MKASEPPATQASAARVKHASDVLWFWIAVHAPNPGQDNHPAKALPAFHNDGQLIEKEKKEQVSLASLADTLNSPDTRTIDSFIDDGSYRAIMLKVLSRFSIYLIAGFVSFLDKCIDETWKRSVPDGAFEGYNQNLTIILDILTAFPLERFPPALFQTAAYGFERVAYYVGPDPGQSWAANGTWNSRKGELSKEIVRELRIVAEQYGYWRLQSLLASLSAD